MNNQADICSHCYKEVIKAQVEYNTLRVEQTNIPLDEKKLMSKVKVIRIIRFALPPDTFCLVSFCEIAKEI